MNILIKSSILLLLCALPVKNMYAQEFKDASGYLQFIEDINSKITSSYLEYIIAIAHQKDYFLTHQKGDELLEKTTKGIDKLKNLKGWEGDSGYKDSVVVYFKTLYYIIKSDYGKLIDLESIKENSYDDIELLLKIQDESIEKFRVATFNMQQEFNQFVKKFNVENIEESKQANAYNQKIKLAEEAINYRRTISMLFINCNSQEQYMVGSINNGDMNALEQNRNALEKYVVENLAKLKNIPPYKNDSALITATRKCLEFYLHETKVYIPKVQEYLNLRNTVAKISKSMEAKGDKVTLEEKEKYQESLSTLNKMEKEVVKMSETKNISRYTLVENWNSTSDAFLDRHVPKK